MNDRQSGFSPTRSYEDSERDLELEVIGQESSARWGRKRGDIATELVHRAIMADCWDGLLSGFDE